MPPIPQFVIYLRPPSGPALVLKEKETLIGRGTFKLSEKGQTVCSRRQACLKLTNTAVQLECQGLNPIYFISCHSANFQATSDTALTSLYLLKKGAVVELADGDKFYLAPKECLITVGIKPVNLRQEKWNVDLTPDSLQLHINEESSFANDVVSPKNTQTDHDLENERHLPFQFGDLEGPLSTGVQGFPSEARWTGNVFNLDAQVPNLDTGPSGESCNCSAVGINGSIEQVDCTELAATVDPALAKVLIDTKDVVQANRASIERKTVVANSTLLASSLSAASEGVGLAVSSANGECCLNLTARDAEAAGNSDIGRGCAPTEQSIGPILSEALKLQKGIASLDSESPLNVVDTDHSGIEVASKLDIISNPTVSGLYYSEASQPQAPGIICGFQIKKAPQSGQPYHPSCSVKKSSAFPLPSIDPDADLSGAQVQVQSPQNHGDRQSSSQQYTETQSEKTAIPHGLPVPRREEANKFDCRTSSRQLEAVDLPAPMSILTGPGQHLSLQGRVLQPNSNSHGNGHVQGMENVIATVSGYDSLVRTRLINVINKTGAVYTGSLTNRNTHVVCWKFKGAKYDLARKLGKFIVTHRWFEDCLKAGSRLAEAPYESGGELEEPLQWEDSTVQDLSSKEENYLFPTREHFQGQSSRASNVSRESAGLVTGSVEIAKHLGQKTVHSRSKNSELDEGRRHTVVDLTSSSDTDILDAPTEGTQGVCGTRNISELEYVEQIGVSGSHHAHHAHEHESDDFWNEVIRTVDDERGKQVVQNLSPGFPETHSNEMLMETKSKPSKPGKSVLVIGGPSFGRWDPDFQIADQRTDRFGGAAHSSGSVQSERLDEATESPAALREQVGNVREVEDDMESHPESLSRKRKHATDSLLSHRNGTSRGLGRKVGHPLVSLELLNTQGMADGSVASSSTGGQSTIVGELGQLTNPVVEPQSSSQQSAGRPDDKRDGIPDAPVPSAEIVCVICHSETKAASEGILTCGHKFCYPCIQRWADEAKLKTPTCPLCKVPFDFITFRALRNAGANESCIQAVEEKIVQVGCHIQHEPHRTNLPVLRAESLCIVCGNVDTPELLLICTNCGERACHTFCLDPPRPPGSTWFCNRCSQTQSRLQTREAYGRLFQGGAVASWPRGALAQDPDPLRRRFEFENNFNSPPLLAERALARDLSSRQQAPFESENNMTALAHSPSNRQDWLTLGTGSVRRIGGSSGSRNFHRTSRRGGQHSLDNFLVRPRE